ncbi:hypothetical protein B0T16DRAFT_396523 [Cercophora newfieldiana]|uniref:Uncharacterized protein n=1 Tax=Cercophora newfieldiana TaxID=92897 RepID=A0AA39YME9_9PEZI|nr:hypothetical protein B0T16DRAFT_396523 [Cercophora newfieldiana]
MGKSWFWILRAPYLTYLQMIRPFFMKTSLECLAGRYRSMQAYYRHDGSLKAA